MAENILPNGVECIFARQPEQVELGYEGICAERVVDNDPFAVLLGETSFPVIIVAQRLTLCMPLASLVKHSLALWNWMVRIFPNTVLLFLVVDQD
jgi:UTP-glucose-1-phosphate uridylyltransferase